MSEIISDICARLEPFWQKTGVSSSQNTSKVPRTHRTAGGAESLVLRLCGFSQTRAFPPANANSRVQVLRPPVWIGGQQEAVDAGWRRPHFGRSAIFRPQGVIYQGGAAERVAQSLCGSNSAAL